MRYEGQVKQRQQKELAAAVIAKVQKELENPKVLQQILQQSVTDIESKNANLLLEIVYTNGYLQRSSLPRLNKYITTPGPDRFAAFLCTNPPCVHKHNLCISQIQIK